MDNNLCCGRIHHPGYLINNYPWVICKLYNIRYCSRQTVKRYFGSLRFLRERVKTSIIMVSINGIRYINYKRNTKSTFVVLRRGLKINSEAWKEFRSNFCGNQSLEKLDCKNLTKMLLKNFNENNKK